MNENLRDLFPKTRLAGSVHMEFKRCGKVKCKCAKGNLHGPYFTRRWRENGRLRRQYVPMAQLRAVLAAIVREKETRLAVQEVTATLRELRHG